MRGARIRELSGRAEAIASTVAGLSIGGLSAVAGWFGALAWQAGLWPLLAVDAVAVIAGILAGRAVRPFRLHMWYLVWTALASMFAGYVFVSSNVSLFGARTGFAFTVCALIAAQESGDPRG